ncbi:MAG: prepilin-type N-terminal cleavage/methylation domain-containing protein [Thermodesulfovibrionales bacterium]
MMKQCRQAGLVRRSEGFTLVELMITMVIFVLVIAASSQIFIANLNAFKQQSRIAESNIEGMAGLEMLRLDLEQAGYGLPWSVDTDGDGQAEVDWTLLAGYFEADATVSAGNPVNRSLYNDANNASGTAGNAPRAVVAGNNVVRNPLVPNCTGANQAWCSDYLVIKATNISTSPAASKWTYITNTALGNILQSPAAVPAADLLQDDERVIAEIPETLTTPRTLLTNPLAGGAFFARFRTNLGLPFPAAFQPTAGTSAVRLVYGIDTNSDLRMPFNRADYYISTTNVPQRCATGTGVLLKGILNNTTAATGGTITTFLPLVDCVADMQVVFNLDTDLAGPPDTLSNADGTTASGAANVATVQATLANATLLRQQLKEIRVYALVQEGQRDPSFTFSGFTSVPLGGCATCIRVGDDVIPAGIGNYGNDFDLSVIPNYLNYRWKVFQMTVTPYNAR